MDEQSSNKKMITTFGLVTMIITAIFGFGNVSNAYLQMSYGSIIWYALAGICFFFPCGLMMAEYGSAFKDAKGGIYSWLAGSIGEKLAFIGTFVWLASWIVWMVSTASRIWITFSALIFGKDTTQQWHFIGLSSTEVIGVLGIVLMIACTYFSSRGMTAIAKVGSLGGIFTVIVNIIYVIAAFIILIANKGALAQPIHSAKDFVLSPNPQFQTPIAIISFVVYAIFAYGGMESLGSVTDSMKKPEKTFPRGLIIASIFTIGAYVLMILMAGWFANYNHDFAKSTTNLGNATYVLFNILGVKLGLAFGLPHATAVVWGAAMTRIVAFAQALGFLGALFVLMYSPIKAFILGSNPELWPKKLTKLNKAGMPANAMWLQVTVVSVIIFLVAFGGSAAQRFYTILTDMANVSTCFPYLFLVGAFPFFKRKKNIERPFEVFKNRFWTDVLVWFVEIILIVGIMFTFIQPMLEKDWQTAFWTIAGPVFFALVAWIFYSISSKKHHING
ncbi:glutamate/gamma-aminobutyrate family transporter YjeM [Limosilactobacillus fastidiosus]|uniref:Glutamate/gamma-aminobutyrate family transporter YjeM n=1 Tax=Limosilactobacillus fastidiosus TaxID=2759855 RepID=A0A7W3TZ99_9LACO|nr:glutamate/gamma-aminobutyrate family transporter YjeM [Limosilactobacillus fastidiosus]MBB1086049.1 glutamate/gamma-aminobutyrate family transporter YjeM [Limosilactobacillus fastidiosus]MCD7085610.1 glutamate/gamma-aminobutyrate family transporter YjeM [Limosilactobacillus fastidiosus]MCD7114182.1 glutamate/gamma-aminobutyrate family transporter YjeM [Limosilactobacillus fastidiosus]MCD7116684.1 glutamate/gamma-aminobutyrate family transporter YjeM [Limosilactobacillus fastidiosus]